MAASGWSDFGDRRYQEDAWLVAERGETRLCVVCDGMGAGTSGHPAAALAVEVIRAAFASGAPPSVVLDAVNDANRAICAPSQAAQRRDPGSDPHWYGMGTTAEVALFVPGRVHLAHVGDGHIYRFRDGTLASMTVAHSLVNECRRAKPDITESELEEVPKNVIVRALGMRPDVEVDRSENDALAGDVWLICSDGLTTLVSDEAIAAILGRGGSPADIAQALGTRALETRCSPWDHKDNITVIVEVVDR